MVKHGLVAARDVLSGQEASFRTAIQRNKGHEFDLPLLDSANALVTFNLVTRDTYSPWGKPDEITFEVEVICKHCRQKDRFRHGRTSCSNGSESEVFSCLCGRCQVRLQFHFRPNTGFDVVDWVPMLGAAVRLSASMTSMALGREDEAQEHWEQAVNDVVPVVVQKRRLLDKDGAAFKVAELLPGSNIVAALLHESLGHPEEADRALHLLRNWRDVGNPDGAIAKVAEAFPGTDLVAFGVHVSNGNFAQALRAVTKSPTVTIRVESVSLLFACSPPRRSRCLELDVAGLQIGPTQRFVTGALLDLVEDFLKPPGGAGSPKTPTKTPTKTPRDPWPRGGHASGCAVGASPSGASSSPEGADGEPGALSEDVKGRAARSVSEALARSLAALEASVPDLVATADSAARAWLATLGARWRAQWPAATARLQRLRGRGLDASPAVADAGEHGDAPGGARTRTDHGPHEARAPLVAAVRHAIRATSMRHHDILPTVEPAHVDVRRLSFWLTALAVAAALLPWLPLCLLLGGLRWCISALGLLLGSLYCAQAHPPLLAACDQAAAWLNVKNAGHWSAACSPSMSGRPESPSRRALRSYFGGGLLSPVAMHSGVVLTVPAEAVAGVLSAAGGYCVAELLAVPWLLRPLCCLLRLAPSLCGLLGAAAVPLVLPLAIPEQVIDGGMVKGWPFEGRGVRVPRIHLALLLELGWGGPGAHGLQVRVLLPDVATNSVLHSVASQVSELDLRRCSRRLSGFKREVHCHLGLRALWPQPDQVCVAATDLRVILHLPA